MDKISKTVRILDMLADAGQEGMRFTDIQFELWNMSHPDREFTRDNRGYWCSSLLGGSTYPRGHRGILHTFATCGEDGRWRRNETPHGGHPWKVIRHRDDVCELSTST